MIQQSTLPKIIAALHLPPFPASGYPDRKSMQDIRDFALRNTELAVQAGISALALQDLGDHPVSRPIPAHIIAGMAVIGSHIREAIPSR